MAISVIRTGEGIRRACVTHTTRNPKPTSRRPLRLWAALAVLPFALLACGSSGHSSSSGSSNQASGANTIVIKNFAFVPSTLTVAPGATVTVRNQDSAVHTVTSSGSQKRFDTGDIAAGATATFTAPSTPGSYSYICQIHQFMHGTLVVR